MNRLYGLGLLLTTGRGLPYEARKVAGKDRHESAGGTNVPLPQRRMLLKPMRENAQSWSNCMHPEHLPPFEDSRRPWGPNCHCECRGL